MARTFCRGQENMWIGALKETEKMAMGLPQGNMLNLLFQFRGEVASFVYDTDLPLTQFPGERKKDRIKYLMRRVFGRIKRVVKQMFEDGQALMAIQIVCTINGEVNKQNTKKKAVA